MRYGRSYDRDRWDAFPKMPALVLAVKFGPIAAAALFQWRSAPCLRPTHAALVDCNRIGTLNGP